MEPGKSIAQLQLGDVAVIERLITDQDIREFAHLSGDDNPIHLDENYASTTKFKHRIAHGHYVASLFSTLLGTKLPGQGSIYLAQQLKYLAPVYLDDVITATATIIEKNVDRNRVKITTEAFNQEGVLVVSGIAEIMPPRKESTQ